MVLVCVCVCVCVCVSPRGGIANFYTRTKVRTALSRYTLHFQLVDFGFVQKLWRCLLLCRCYIGSGVEVTLQSRYVMLVAIGHSCSILLYQGFSELYRSSTVSLDCRTLDAVSISMQLCQAPSTFHPEHQ